MELGFGCTLFSSNGLVPPRPANVGSPRAGSGARVTLRGRLERPAQGPVGLSDPARIGGPHLRAVGAIGGVCNPVATAERVFDGTTSSRPLAKAPKLFLPRGWEQREQDSARYA